jgi:hypothetical protein
MTHDEAIKLLDVMKASGDNERLHSEADAILLRYLEHHDAKEVADAYVRARARVGFWYA